MIEVNSSNETRNLSQVLGIMNQYLVAKHRPKLPVLLLKWTSSLAVSCCWKIVVKIFCSYALQYIIIIYSRDFYIITKDMSKIECKA